MVTHQLGSLLLVRNCKIHKMEESQMRKNTGEIHARNSG